MKKILTVLFLSILLTACSNLPDKPRGEYDESREWNNYILQMVIKEAENYIKAAENKTISDEEATVYYEKVMDYIPKGYNDDRDHVIHDIINITSTMLMNELEETKIEVNRMKYVYDINND